MILDFRHRLRHCCHYSLDPFTSDHIFKDPGSIYQAPGRLELLPSSAECPTSLKIDDYSIATPLRWKGSKLKLAPESQTHCVQQAVHLVTTLFPGKILVTQGRPVGF